MRISKLIITNFNSFKSEVVTFPSEDDCVLILGDNRDSMGQSSNGAGKTSLFQTISYALFGKIPKGGYVDDIIREGTKQTEVEAYFTNQKDTLKILRKRGTESSLEFWVNDSNDHPKSTSTVTQNSLLEYLGINPDNKDYYTDFINTTYFSVDSLKAFASKETSSEEKMKLITRILNLERLDLAAKDVKKRRQIVEKKIDTKNYMLKNIEDSLSNLGSPEEIKKNKVNIEVKIEGLKSDIEIKRKKIESAKQIIPLQTALMEVNNTLFKDESDFVDKLEYFKDVYSIKEKRIHQIVELQNQKKQIELKVKKLPKLQEINDSIELLEEELGIICKKELSMYPKILELDYNIKQDEQLLKKALSCPQCKTDLMITTDTKLQQFDKKMIEERLFDYRVDLSKLKEQKTAIKEDKEKHYLSITKYKEVKSELMLLFKEIELIKVNPDEIDNIEKELIQLKLKKDTDIKKHGKVEVVLLKKKEDIEVKLKKTEQSNIDVDKLEKDIDKCGVVIDAAHSAYAQLTQYELQRIELTKQQNQLVRNTLSCTKIINNFLIIEDCYTTIRRWKIKNFLPEFEDISNKYLKDIKCGYQISLDTMEEKRSAKKDESKLKLKFTIDVISENGYIRNINTFSKGESTRIAICLGLALKDIATQRSNMPFEFTLLDDVAGEIDETGGEEISKLLNKISGLKMVITQNDYLAKNFINVIKVVKENGISTVVKEK